MKRKETFGPLPESKRIKRLIKGHNKENITNKNLNLISLPETEEASKNRVGFSSNIVISKAAGENRSRKSIEKSIEQLQLLPLFKTEIQHKDNDRDQKVVCDEAHESVILY